VTPTIRVVDRLLTGLLGLILLIGGLWLLGYAAGLRFLVRATHHLSPRALAGLPERGWWHLGLGVVAAVLVLGCLGLLLAHLRRGRVRRIGEGAGTVDLHQVARAAADDLAAHPSVHRATAHTAMVAGRPAVTLRAQMVPGTTVTELRRLVRRYGDDVRAAAGIDLDFQLVAEPANVTARRTGARRD
jgi:hypothetical protein